MANLAKTLCEAGFFVSMAQSRRAIALKTVKMEGVTKTNPTEEVKAKNGTEITVGKTVKRKFFNGEWI